MVAVNYSNRDNRDLLGLLEILQRMPQRWASTKQDWAMREFRQWPSHCSPDPSDRDQLKCAVLSCGYMFDLDGSTGVTGVAKQVGFVQPGAGKSVDDVPEGAAVYVRAAQEQFPYLNDVLDGFVAFAFARNLPTTLMNHQGPHGFELMQDATSRETIKQMLAFLAFNLSSELTGGSGRSGQCARLQ